MRKLKSLITILVSFGLLFSLLPVQAEIDYAAEEGKWKQICTDPDLSKENRADCQGYTDYLKTKVDSSEGQINKYKGEMEKNKGDLAKQLEIAEEYGQKITEIEMDIARLNENIIVLQNNIERIEAEIIAREAEIEEKDQIIVERMRKTQSDIRFGHEIDFLIKARDFATLIASASVVNDIMDFEAIQIEEINKLIDKQKDDQKMIVFQQETVKQSIADAKLKKAEVITLKAEVDIAVENHKALIAEMAILQSQARADASAVRKQMDAISEALIEVQASGGFVRPIAGGRISARVWAYPNGGRHLAYDYAAPIGTPIRAAANGLVLLSNDNCPTWGGYPNSCGHPGLWGGGNQVILLVTVGSGLYANTYAHMQSGSPIRSGQIVSSGQIIGRVGSSGSSTGPHVHAEVIYLGNQSINEYLNSWDGYLGFGVGFTLANRCDFNGNNPPCRMDPGKAYGYN